MHPCEGNNAINAPTTSQNVSSTLSVLPGLPVGQVLVIYLVITCYCNFHSVGFSGNRRRYTMRWVRKDNRPPSRSRGFRKMSRHEPSSTYTIHQQLSTPDSRRCRCEALIVYSWTIFLSTESCWRQLLSSRYSEHKHSLHLVVPSTYFYLAHFIKHP
jgi:hypothetical protein